MTITYSKHPRPVEGSPERLGVFNRIVYNSKLSRAQRSLLTTGHRSKVNQVTSGKVPQVTQTYSQHINVDRQDRPGQNPSISRTKGRGLTSH
jgi:hypothetical protein